MKVTARFLSGRRLIIKQIFLLTGLLFGPACSAQTQWELGIGVGVLDIPYYPGAAQSKTYVLPIPHISYISERLEIDDGIAATLLKTPRLRLNFSADLGVPVNSRDSTVRAGMPDLDFVVQLGPSLEITLAGGRFKPSHTRLELPVRAAIATDFSSADSVGWVFEPRLTYESRRPYKTGFAHLVSGGLRISTEQLNEYYYNVDPAYATVTRPAYDTGSGYSGLFIDYIANWRAGNLVYWALMRYQYLDHTVFEDSPLVEREDYLLVGAGVSWIFASNL